MKFIALDRAAASECVRRREFQSVDFQLGEELAAALAGEMPVSEKLLEPIQLCVRNEGLFLLSSATDSTHCLVYDLVATQMFAGRPHSDVLAIFQRVTRFALKIWDNLSFSHNEHVAKGQREAKYVVFPFPITSQSKYRIALDRVSAQAEGKSDHLLVYSGGTDEGKGPDEIPSRARLHEALSAMGEACKQSVAARLVQPEPARELIVTTLPTQTTPTGYSLPYDNWLPLLTRVQKNFVLRPLRAPERLEGPAGTGKTLALLLKAVTTLRTASASGVSHHSLFVTHSVATKNAIQARLQIIEGEDGYSAHDRYHAAHSLTVTTLQEWCQERLGKEIHDVELLDRDAASSKELQLLNIVEALDRVIVEDLPTFRRLLSPRIVQMLATDDRWRIAEMVQHEIGVVIKGRASEDLEKYKNLPPLLYNLPIANEHDRSFFFLIYKEYQRRLIESGHFDTDDVVLSAISQLDTPIWRRRREQEGFDSVFLDEAHLFNMNELSVIHFLPRTRGEPPIAFAIDRAQAEGDRGIEGMTLDNELLQGVAQANPTSMTAVFRSSAEITALALSVTTNGATLFTNFVNPLIEATSVQAAVDSELSATPELVEAIGDEALVLAAFGAAEKLADKVPGGRAAVAIIAFDSQLLRLLNDTAKARHKPLELLDRRGDAATVERAHALGRYVLSSPEYVGGLEFDAVVLVGIDGGRVPPTPNTASESTHFLRYRAHNHLYVAITRARYRVVVVADAARGVSEILEPALQRGLLVRAP